MESLLLFLSTFCDAAESWQFSLQDPASPSVEGMIFFHNYLCFFLIVIGFSTFWVLWVTLSTFNEVFSKKSSQRFTHSSLLEIIWTILPAFALLLISIPSFALLYSLDEVIDPSVTLKVTGSQWFWSYEYSDACLNVENLSESSFDLSSLNFDSYMVPTNELVLGSFRLLEVDNRVILPTKTHIRILVTATDVLHSWAIPSFGIKIDACPGRLSQAFVYIKRAGTYFGQCSEICGVNHGFMPVVIKALPSEAYTSWVAQKLLSDLE
jgi:cytochrome c oxidase subunit 2